MHEGLAAVLALKYAGYAVADTAHLHSCVSKLFLKGSASSESSPPSQRV